MSGGNQGIPLHVVTIYTHILVFLDYNHLQSFGHGRGPWSECQTSPRKRILEHL